MSSGLLKSANYGCKAFEPCRQKQETFLNQSPWGSEIRSEFSESSSGKSAADAGAHRKESLGGSGRYEKVKVRGRGLPNYGRET